MRYQGESRIYGLPWKIEEKKKKRNESKEEKEKVSGVCMCVRVHIRER